MAPQPDPVEPTVTVIFITRRTSGVARRMDSLIAHLQTRERRRARIRKLDADADAELVARLGVEEIPAIVVLKDRRVVGRMYGPATMPEIDRLVRPFLDAQPEPPAPVPAGDGAGSGGSAPV